MGGVLEGASGRDGRHGLLYGRGLYAPRAGDLIRIVYHPSFNTFRTHCRGDHGSVRLPFVGHSENIWHIITLNVIIRVQGIGCWNHLPGSVQSMSQFIAANALAVCSVTTIVKQPESENSVYCAIRARFRGGGRAQVSSLSVDDPLTSDEKGVYFSYTQTPINSLLCSSVTAFCVALPPAGMHPCSCASL